MHVILIKILAIYVISTILSVWIHKILSFLTSTCVKALFTGVICFCPAPARLIVIWIPCLKILKYMLFIWAKHEYTSFWVIYPWISSHILINQESIRDWSSGTRKVFCILSLKSFHMNLAGLRKKKEGDKNNISMSIEAIRVLASIE